MKVYPLLFPLALLLTAPAAPAAAADLWLEPVRFRQEVPEGEQARIGVRAQLGDWKGAKAQVRGRATDLRVQDPYGWREVKGRAGDDPIGMLELRGEGAHWITYRGQLGYGRLGNAGWMRLYTEGGRDPADAPTEVTGVQYRRSAKALVLTGHDGQDAWAEPLGLELELVPLNAPHELEEIPRKGPSELEPLRLKLLHRGKAQVGVELRAWHLSERLPEPIRARTNAKGEAALALPTRGEWVIAATTIHPGDLTQHEVAFTTLSLSLDPAPPARGPEVLARLVRRARQRQLLRPLLGKHHFTFNRRHFDGQGKSQGTHETLMTYDVRLEESGEDPTLRVAVDVSPRGAPHGIVFEYAVGLDDGRLRFLENQDGSFVPKGGRLKTARGEHAVDPAILLPKVVGVFLLPQLSHALGGEVPAQLRIVDLTPFATLSRSILLRKARRGEPDFSPEFETWVTEEGRAIPTTRVRAARKGPFAGKLIEIRTRSQLGPKNEVLSLNDCNRITSQAYDELWREWFGEAPK